jgi:hypothetical protein
MQRLVGISSGQKENDQNRLHSDEKHKTQSSVNQQLLDVCGCKHREDYCERAIDCRVTPSAWHLREDPISNRGHRLGSRRLPQPVL